MCNKDSYKELHRPVWCSAWKENCMEHVDVGCSCMCISTRTHLMRETMEDMSDTREWFLANICARGDPFQENQEPYFSSRAANPLSSKILS